MLIISKAKEQQQYFKDSSIDNCQGVFEDKYNDEILASKATIYCLVNSFEQIGTIYVCKHYHDSVVLLKKTTKIALSAMQQQSHS